MNALTLVQHNEGSAEQHPLLRLLRDGKPAALKLGRVHMRNKRIPEPRLFFTPMELFGGEKGKVLVALEGQNCEEMELRNLDRMRLWRIGLTFDAVDALIHEINKLGER